MQGGIGASVRHPLLGLLLAHCLLTAASVRLVPAAVARRSAKPAPDAPLSERKMEVFVHELEANARHLLAHIRAYRGLTPDEAKDRDHAAGLLEGALTAGLLEGALTAEQGAFRHALVFHGALWAAEGFLRRWTRELGRRHSHLAEKVQEEQGRALYAMLKRRRSLPMSSQAALLRRPQFGNCTYARQLLRRHGDSSPLYKQLVPLLPSHLVHQLLGSGPATKQHLAAAGSEGRVHIVSSRLKNDVKKMQGELRQARERISQFLTGSSTAGQAERRQAQQVLAGLDGVLRKANGTNDLGVQLEAMDEMLDKLRSWMP